ncbi:hypothetical protein A0165_RS19485 [Acinetobacter baumannii]|nr:hypothetical protein [Acinetobacter baumannii]
MNSVLPAQLKMLEKVAEALSEEFLREMVFIGGCTTALLHKPICKGFFSDIIFK